MVDFVIDEDSAMEFERARRIPYMLPQNMYYRRPFYSMDEDDDLDYDEDGKLNIFGLAASKSTSGCFFFRHDSQTPGYRPLLALGQIFHLAPSRDRS